MLRLEANFQENMTKENNEASMVSGTVLDFAINLLFSSIRGLQEIKEWEPKQLHYQPPVLETPISMTCLRNNTISHNATCLGNHTINHLFEKLTHYQTTKRWECSSPNKTKELPQAEGKNLNQSYVSKILKLQPQAGLRFHKYKPSKQEIIKNSFLSPDNTKSGLHKLAKGTVLIHTNHNREKRIKSNAIIFHKRSSI